MVKICSICKLAKSFESFYVRDGSRNRLHAQCKDCYKEKRKSFMEEHYKKYGDQYRSRARIRKMVQKRARQEKLVNYLEDKKCEFCGFSDIRALHFDHIDPSKKEFGIARAINDGYHWDRTLKEIEKCRILCANCHRIRTAQHEDWIKWRLGRVVRQDSAKVRTAVQIR